MKQNSQTASFASADWDLVNSMTRSLNELLRKVSSGNVDPEFWQVGNSHIYIYLYIFI